MPINKINLAKVTTDAGTQVRIDIDQNRVASFAELMSDGVTFDPVVVFNDGKSFYLADGFHRYFASKKAGLADIEANIRNGSLRDAILFSLSANAMHGLPLSSSDKRKAVQVMLADDEWNMWSDREIARHCGASHTTVQNIRNQMKAPAPSVKPAPVKAEPRVEKPVEPPAEAVDEEMDEFVEQLKQRNDELEKIVALKTLPEEERESAGSLIDELREDNRLLRIELEAVKRSRDTFQAENAQLKKQVATYQRKLKQTGN